MQLHIQAELNAIAKGAWLKLKHIVYINSPITLPCSILPSVPMRTLLPALFAAAPQGGTFCRAKLRRDPAGRLPSNIHQLIIPESFDLSRCFSNTQLHSEGRNSASPLRSVES